MQAFRQALCSVALLFVPLCLAPSQSFAQTSVNAQYGPFWAGLTNTLRSTTFVDPFDVLLLGAFNGKLYLAYKRNGTYIAVNPAWFDVSTTGSEPVVYFTLHFGALYTPLPPNLAGNWSVQAIFALQYNVYDPFFGTVTMIACNVNLDEPCYDEASGQIN